MTRMTCIACIVSSSHIAKVRDLDLQRAYARLWSSTNLLENSVYDSSLTRIFVTLAAIISTYFLRHRIIMSLLDQKRVSSPKFVTEVPGRYSVTETTQRGWHSRRAGAQLLYCISLTMYQYLKSKRLHVYAPAACLASAWNETNLNNPRNYSKRLFWSQVRIRSEKACNPARQRLCLFG